MSDTYKIVRFYQGNHPKEVLRTGLTLEEAQDHCEDPETSYQTATGAGAQQRTRVMGPWFDGYDKE